MTSSIHARLVKRIDVFDTKPNGERERGGRGLGDTMKPNKEERGGQENLS